MAGGPPVAITCKFNTYTISRGIEDLGADHGRNKGVTDFGIV
jgi:hypothetical protein